MRMISRTSYSDALGGNTQRVAKPRLPQFAMRETKTDFSIREAAMKRAVDAGLFSQLRKKWKVLMLKPLKFGPELELPVWMMADGQDSKLEQRFDTMLKKLERLFQRFYKPEIQAGDFTGVKVTLKARAPLCCGSSCDCCPLVYSAKKASAGLRLPLPSQSSEEP